MDPSFLPQQVSVRALVTFHDVAACFSAEDWRQLEDWQKELYKNVMREIHSALVAMGYTIQNPEQLLRVHELKETSQDTGKGKERNNLLTAGAPVFNPDISLWIREVVEENFSASQNPEPTADPETASSELPVVKPDIFLRIKPDELLFEACPDPEPDDGDTGESAPSVRSGISVTIDREVEPFWLNIQETENEDLAEEQDTGDDFGSRELEDCLTPLQPHDLPTENSSHMSQEDWDNTSTIRLPRARKCQSIYRIGQSLPQCAYGSVWSLEWCPTLGGSGSCQYLALYCHLGMDDRHKVDSVHLGPALLQLWSLGPLDMENSCDSGPVFSYGLALDHGCIWDLKFCPSGGWELPCTSRKNTQMARLGLLAAAFSSGHIEIYSLPHPESLYSHRKSQVKAENQWDHTVCKTDCVVRLQVGSIKASSPGESGQCFTLAWHPAKPHQYLAAGFYDGTVSIWDLKTKSVLQRVRQGGVIKQYPSLCFLSHDHAVRSVEWCKADSNFLVTSGNDRRLKFWDLRRLPEPINNMKRFHSTEISWLLPYTGVVVAQDNCYASHGLCGIHYVDSGFLGYKPYFVTPRKGTVWSVSGSDWLSCITAGDITGEVIVIVLPNLNVPSINTKRPGDRKFPIYKADFLPHAPVTPQCAATELPAGPLAQTSEWGSLKPKSFRAAADRFGLRFQDMDIRDFKRLLSREPVKRMHSNETKGDLNMERVQIEAVHKVRFSPNLDTYAWVASGGHSGLLRVHCIQGLMTSVGRKLIQEKSSQFRAMFEQSEPIRECDFNAEVQHCVIQV